MASTLSRLESPYRLNVISLLCCSLHVRRWSCSAASRAVTSASSKRKRAMVRSSFFRAGAGAGAGRCSDMALWSTPSTLLHTRPRGTLQVLATFGYTARPTHPAVHMGPGRRRTDLFARIKVQKPGVTVSVATAELTGRDAQKLAYVFPGQGSQYVGMGKALYEASSAARRVFQQADEILGFKLSQLCFEGPADELEDTINAQPAILTVSMACLAAMREKIEAVGHNWQPPRFVAGHSLGEYTALVAAGSLDFSDALRLVRERGRLMKEQGDHRPGGMAAVIGLGRADLEVACEQSSNETGRIVSVANANSPAQFVISGDLAALDRAIVLLREAGARTVVPLRISIASHSPLMQQAASRLAEIIDRSPLRD